MKSKLKSVFISCLLALPLAGCDSLGLPHVFSNDEVPQEVIDAPRVVAQPTQEQIKDAKWPQLATVPSAPKDFSPKKNIELDMYDLMQDREEGQQEMKEYMELQATQPPVLPTADVPPQPTTNFLQQPTSTTGN